ncbi:dUTPase [Bacillus sp. RG28]|uniref:dUTP diphosphatase n=1 Tax=Gottfriedia endophytica TaxID=2820819 RepID=A0A940SKC9_9BACI|nr:dUTPase [Gottfriedia endophytica]MBP0725884.1 dUTPase [Gottfriedia endophytica]
MEKIRGFEVAKGFEELKPNLPKRSTQFAAGYDFECVEEVVIKPNEIKLVPTGIKAYMQRDEYLGLYLRSSIPLKKGLMKGNSVGIVDSDYYSNPSNDGHIMFQVINVSNQPVVIEKGERIGQGIFQKFFLTDDDIAGGERTSGFGSTGK